MTVQTLPAPHDARPGTSALTVRDAAYTYSTGTSAVQGLSLHVGRAESVAIVGPSGCGKSTLLALIAGLIRPAAGRIDWDLPVDRVERERSHLALVFQRDTLLPWLTVEGNVGLGLRYRRIPRQLATERVSWLLELAGLQDFARAYPYQLSGGMRRRVAFLAGVAPLPQVLLLDEPFSSLDEPTRIGIHQEVMRIVRRLEMSLILVTHDIAEAISLSDRLYVLTRRPGRIAAEFSMPFGRERNMFALREQTKFLDIYRQVWQALRLQLVEAGTQSLAETSAVRDA